MWGFSFAAGTHCHAAVGFFLGFFWVFFGFFLGLPSRWCRLFRREIENKPLNFFRKGKIAFRVASALLGTKSPKLAIFRAVCVYHGLDFAKNCTIFKENLKKMHIFRKKMHFFLIFCGENLHKWKFCINFAVEFNL